MGAAMLVHAFFPGPGGPKQPQPGPSGPGTHVAIRSTAEPSALAIERRVTEAESTRYAPSRGACKMFNTYRGAIAVSAARRVDGTLPARPLHGVLRCLLGFRPPLGVLHPRLRYGPPTAGGWEFNGRRSSRVLSRAAVGRNLNRSARNNARRTENVRHILRRVAVSATCR